LGFSLASDLAAQYTELEVGFSQQKSATMELGMGLNLATIGDITRQTASYLS
jgi:hypothetical protein